MIIMKSSKVFLLESEFLILVELLLKGVINSAVSILNKDNIVVTVEICWLQPRIILQITQSNIFILFEVRCEHMNNITMQVLTL
jgi:hypothetical protein